VILQLYEKIRVTKISIISKKKQKKTIIIQNLNRKWTHVCLPNISRASCMSTVLLRRLYCESWMTFNFGFPISSGPSGLLPTDAKYIQLTIDPTKYK